MNFGSAAITNVLYTALLVVALATLIGQAVAAYRRHLRALPRLEIYDAYSATPTRRGPGGAMLSDLKMFVDLKNFGGRPARIHAVEIIFEHETIEAEPLASQIVGAGELVRVEVTKIFAKFIGHTAALPPESEKPAIARVTYSEIDPKAAKTTRDLQFEPLAYRATFPNSEATYSIRRPGEAE